MPHLTKRDRTQLKLRLTTERSALLEEAQDELRQASTNNYSTLAGESPDFGDQSVAVSLVDYDNAMSRRHTAALQEIDAALARLEEGGFGHCADCDGEIDRGRLEVFPTARRCAECQEHHDRTYAHGATPSL